MRAWLPVAIVLMSIGTLNGAAHAASAMAQAPRVFWAGAAGRVEARGCPGRADSYCLVWTRAEGGVLSTPVETLPSDVSLLWRGGEQGASSARTRMDEPDLLFYADGGGSGICGSYIALDFTHDPHFQSFRDCQQVERRRDETPGTGPFGFIADFPVESPFGAPNSQSVSAPYPVVWRRGGFALDVTHLVPASPPANARAVIHAETAALIAPGAVAGTGLPHTTKIMLDLVFAGHAAGAHALVLASAAPGFRADLYWHDLCAILIADPNWMTLMHDALPGSADIERDARTGVRVRALAAYREAF